MKHAVTITFLFLTSCASSKKVLYSVNTVPQGAEILVNGNTICDESPCDIWLQCSKAWVGMMNSPSGYANSSGPYQVEAIPRQNMVGSAPLYSDKRSVDPCLISSEGVGKINFNLNMRSYAPVQSIEIKGNK